MKTLFIIITVSLFSYITNSQSPDSCTSNLILNAQIPFDISSLTCQSVWDSQNFILRYAQTSPSLWSFILSAPNTNSYVAIGFSTSGNMVGSSAIVGWVATDGSAMMQKYYLGGQTPNQVRRGQGNLKISSNSATIVSESSRIYVIFQLETNRPENRLLYAVGPAGTLPVGPEFQLSEHSDKILTRINYASGSSSSRVIPGPAGAVDFAMHQRNLDRENLSTQQTPIATQEYIRRATEDPVKDEAFQDGPWLSAMEFLTEAGTYYPLSSIKKKCHTINRVDQVVAVIKSCTPNGFGDLWVTLKDPTDTIEASIHHKVTESEFGKDISVGSVLILQKVVVWHPISSRSARYLNITLPNVFKVFPKNDEVNLAEF